MRRNNTTIPIGSRMLPLLLATAALGGCATFRPVPLEEVPFRDRALSQEDEGVEVSDDDTKGFNFFVPVGGIVADHQTVDFDSLYADAEIIDLADEEALRKAIRRGARLPARHRVLDWEPPPRL